MTTPEQIWNDTQLQLALALSSEPDSVFWLSFYLSNRLAALGTACLRLIQEALTAFERKFRGLDSTKVAEQKLSFEEAKDFATAFRNQLAELGPSRPPSEILAELDRTWAELLKNYRYLSRFPLITLEKVREFSFLATKGASALEAVVAARPLNLGFRVWVPGTKVQFSTKGSEVFLYPSPAFFGIHSGDVFVAGAFSSPVISVLPDRFVVRDHIRFRLTSFVVAVQGYVDLWGMKDRLKALPSPSKPDTANTFAGDLSQTKFVAGANKLGGMVDFLTSTPSAELARALRTFGIKLAPRSPGLVDICSTYEPTVGPGAKNVADQLRRILKEKSFTKAYDFLTMGDFDRVFAMDVNEASYQAAARQAVEDLSLYLRGT